MKPPVVFLVPENFIGPVFVIFDQEDGQELRSDPLGVSLTVPENGLIKVKASKNEVLTRGMNYDKRNVYWISLNKDGQRMNMPYQGGGARDYDKEVFWTWYIDTNNQAKQMAFDPKLYPKTNDSEIYHLTKDQVKLKTAYAWNTCDAYIWKNIDEYKSYMNDLTGALNKEKTEFFDCMQFHISYPKMNDKELSYENFLGDYSLPEFEEKLNEIQPFRIQYLEEYLELNKNKKD
ncbi:hypothetical protein [Acinetobacter sp. ANC 3832]|uniref:hypothetical protein n=1 Tax=Acinetobacter sp. ANC 3832 TaxID=1977874 RepID=UPI000A33FE1C|nr:hypothetical protein [Acinetobacter sp. ANC 3832]OTG87949.1 hypothetical protein B9T35_17425 [Acinetobacter sp. ANC 3832]